MKLEGHSSARRLREAIHDEIGPSLFFVATRVKLLKDELAGRKRSQAAAILAELEELRGQVRRLARGLEEAPVNDLALALDRLASEVGGTFRNDLVRPIKGDRKADLLFRIAREAAHNAVRHGGGKVSIRLAPGILEVEDNGSGLPRQRRDGIGMALMKRRARELGGRLTIQRGLKGGTVLACHFGSRPG